MKKTTIMISVLLLVAIFITACGAAGSEISGELVDNVAAAAEDSNAPADANQAAAAEGVQERLAEGEMSLSMKLTLGTFKLDETDYAVDAEQAASLLPLWKALRSLSESQTAATEELQAILNQIQDSMTPEQIAAIEGMGLTGEDMSAIFQELGLEFGGGEGRFGNLTPEQQATMQAARESGEFPGGGIPGSGLGQGRGGGNPGEVGLSPEARETAVAERGGTRGANLGLNPALLEAIITFLQGKI